MVAWIVERYLPDATKEQVDDDAARLTAATLALAGDGADIRYLGTTFVAADEYCICRFESTSVDDVRLACDRAGVSYSRVVRAQEMQSTPGGSGRTARWLRIGVRRRRL
jgi:hypothetical protein